MTAFHHGITAREPLSGIIPIRTSATAIIGLVAWADDVDPIAFPLNTPVLITSITRALKSVGYGGTLRRALEGIQPITNPTIVVIRCASDSTANVVGNVVAGVRTGIQALLTAKSKVGVTPKILIAPQLENPDVDQAMIAVCKKLRAYYYSTPRDTNRVMLASMELVQAYRDTLGDREIELIWPEFTGGNVLQDLVVVETPTAVELLSTDSEISPDIDDQLTITVNGITTQSEAWTDAIAIAEGAPDQWVLRAFIAAGLDVTTSMDGDITYHWIIQQKSVAQNITVTSDNPSIKFRFLSPAGAVTQPSAALQTQTFTIAADAATPTYSFGNLPTVAIAAALRADIDQRIGFHKSLSNVVVNGPTGISQDITWDLEDPDTDAGFLNSHDITTLIQHQGFRFWGNRNCSSDPRFAFEVATRTAQVLLDTIINGVFPFVDAPLTPKLAKDIIDSINAKLQEFVSAGQLIGASCWYDEAQNNAQQLSQGQMWIDYDFTPVPTLENLGLNQRITDRYLVDFAKLIAQAA